MSAINLYMRGNPTNSYGKIALALTKALTDIGVQVNVRGDLHKEAEPWLVEHLGQGWVDGHLKSKTWADVTLCFYKPQDVPLKHGTRGKRMWLLTMSESDTAPSRKWVGYINQYYERVFVACDELVPIYQTNGVEVPVEVIPLGVDFSLPPPQSPKTQGNGNGSGTFVWLTHCTGDGRKGGEDTVKAFKQAFGGDMRFRLWVKSIYTRNNWLAEVKDSQVAVVPGTLSEMEWWDLLQSVQGFVWLTHGEGFGLPPREATLAGLPSVGTQWLGMKDIDCWGLPVKVAGKSEARFIQVEANEPGGLWADADVDHAVEQMRWVVDNYDAARCMAGQGRKYLMQHFAYAKTADSTDDCRKLRAGAGNAGAHLLHRR